MEAEKKVENRETEPEHYNSEKPISLNPLEFDEAVSDLLKVKPEQKEKKKGESP